jgi:hypothetical protein
MLKLLINRKLLLMNIILNKMKMLKLLINRKLLLMNIILNKMKMLKLLINVSSSKLSIAYILILDVFLLN